MAIDMSKMRDRKRALDSRNNGSTNGVEVSGVLKMGNK